jgi:hypothetical protein
MAGIIGNNCMDGYVKSHEYINVLNNLPRQYIPVQNIKISSRNQFARLPLHLSVMSYTPPCPAMNVS